MLEVAGSSPVIPATQKVANFRISPVNIDSYNNCDNILIMGKLLAIITLILPLLLSQNSWASSLPECQGSPLNESNWQESSEWNNCQGAVTFFEGLSEEGEWIYGKLKWQSEYNRNEHLSGIWEIKTNSINEKIYFYDQWIGFLNSDLVCQILFTEKPFIRNKNAKDYGVKNLTFIVLGTNCKTHKFQEEFQTSFDNVFIANEGELVLFQTKILKENEETGYLNRTFPNGALYNSFEKKDVGFLMLKRITKNISKEDFLSKFKHKFKSFTSN